MTMVTHMPSKQTLLSLALIGASTVATAQSADLIYGNNAHVISKIMMDEGYKAKLTFDDEGEPKIAGRLSESNYDIQFFGCKSRAGCNSIMFRAGYDLNEGLSFSKVNTWNRSKRFGKAYVDDENDPFIEMNVNLDFGVTPENFLDTVDYWRVVIEEFEEHIDW